MDLPTSTAVELADYAAVREALRQRSLAQALYDEGGALMERMLLTLHGEEHLRRRRAENRLFRRATFRRLEEEVVPALIARAYAPAVAAGRADLPELGHRTTMNLTALVAGVDLRGEADETERLLGYVHRFSEGATVVHSTRDHAEVRAEVAAALAEFREEFLESSIARRLALLATGVDEDELPHDVLTVLLRRRDELGVDDDLICREVAFYLQAGSHSSATAFTHAVHDVFGLAPGDRALARADMSFLQRCVHESLRLNPASPVAWRRATADCTVAGHAVSAGDLVVLDLRAANRDAAVFGPDAAEFDPRRSLPPAMAAWGHTFGGGMHACIGMELDAGATPPADRTPAADHLYGTVPLMVQTLLEHGARPDPADPPELDATSERPHFGRYPVLLGP